MSSRLLSSGLAAATGLALASPCLAQQVVYASGGTVAELQAAVDSLAGPGVVVLPAGTWDVVGRVSIATDDVTLIGAGSRHSVLRRPAPPGGISSDDLTSLYRTGVIRIEGAARARVAHLAVRGWEATTASHSETGIAVGNALDYRVDHVRATFTGSAGVGVGGESTGVVDHSVFANIYEPVIGNLGYGVTIGGTKVHSGEPFGSPRATFVEDNQMSGCRHAVASNTGARYVFRHNHVSANEAGQAVDAHGAEYPPTPRPDCPPCYETDNPGTEWVEIYSNVIDAPVHTSRAIALRGGKGVVWDNTIHGYSTAVGLYKQTPEPTGPIHIWGNHLSSGTTTVTSSGSCCGDTPSYQLSELSGYQPYAYPHPLVVDLQPSAGPDATFMVAEGTELAAVFVDGSGSSASEGTIDAWAWRVSPEILSTCVRDVLELPAGTHVLLLEARRDDGLVEYDTALIEVVASGPLPSSPEWPNVWFAPFPGSGTVRFTVTPSAVTDAYVGLAARRLVDAHDDHVAQVRLNYQGFFDARNGDAYEADATIGYEAGEAYEVELRFDVAAQTYDVSVDGVLLGQGFAFRREEAQVGQLSVWNGEGDPTIVVTEIAFEGEQLGPDAACVEPPDAGPTPDASSPDSGGAAGHGGDPATPPDPVPGIAPESSEGGCGCRLAGVGPTRPWAYAALLVAAASARRPRRTALPRTRTAATSSSRCG